MVDADRTWPEGRPRVIEGFAVEPERRWEHPSARTFLHSLDAHERAAVRAAGSDVTFTPGQRVYAERDIDTHAIVIRTGWTKVSVTVRGRERIIAVRGPGEIVGERAAVNAGGRSADVTALEEVRALMIPGDRFRALLAEHPRIGEVLQRQEAERRIEEGRPLVGATDVVDVERRLAGLLLELALSRGGHQHDGAVTIDLPMSPQDLARWVDADHEIETVLTAWRRQGVVTTSAGHLVVADAAALERIVGAAQPVPRWALHSPPDAPLHHSILFTDIAGFGDRRRSDDDRATIHEELLRLLHTAFEASGVQWQQCIHSDRGDGTLSLAPPMIAPNKLVDPFLAHLAAGLRRHNRRYNEPCQMRLRVAMHTGPVSYLPKGGYGGQAIIDASRMVDAPVLKEALAASGADLAFLTSSHVYDTVIRHRAGFVDAEAFEPVDVSLKEAEFPGWMYLAGVGVRA